MADREMDPGDGGAAAITAGLLVVAVVVIGLVFFFGAAGPQAEVIDLDAAGSMPVASAPVQLANFSR